MAPDDVAAARLDRAVDALRSSTPSPTDPIATVLVMTRRRLHALAGKPAPKPAFVRHPRGTPLSDLSPPRPNLVALPLSHRRMPDDCTLPSTEGWRMTSARLGGWRFAANLVAGVLLILSLAGAAIAGGHLFPALTSSTPSARAGLFIGTPTPRVVPARFQSAAAEVDARIQGLDSPADVVSSNVIDDPWTVAWHRETGTLGVPGNVVLGGHLDHYTVGPAVFWTLHELTPGDVIELTGDNGGAHFYAVDWIREYALADLTAELRRGLVGPTPDQTLTVITEAGKFDPIESAYDARTVVRGHRITAPGTPAAATPAG